MKENRNPIYLPFRKYQWVGGPVTFMQNLQRYLDRQKFSYLPSLKGARVVFFSTTITLPKLDKIKQQGGYVIQRLDGVYYPSKHGEEYLEINRDPKKIYEDYADVVIFQSLYSQAQCFAMFGKRDEYQIVINGVDKSIFYPAQSRKDLQKGEKIQFVTTGRFRNIDMIEPVVKALDMLKQTIDFELTVIGPIANPQLEPYFQRAYIRHIDALSLPEISEVLRASDIFIYSHLNPPCPNSVIEAISCGLPVVGFDSGAMSELCFFSRELLAYVSDEVFQEYGDFDAHKLAEKITKAVEDYDHYRDVALTHSHLYSFEECGQQYLGVFQHYLNKRKRLQPYVTYQLKQGMKRIQRLPYSIKYRLLKRLVLLPGSFVQRLLLSLDHKQFVQVIFSVIEKKTSSLIPADSLKLLFNLESMLYGLEGQEAIRYGDGLHTKHRHIKYHDFFVQRIEPGSRVLDVGCGNGALAYDIATQVANVSVYGIDIDSTDIEYARQNYSAENIEFVCGNVLCDLPDRSVDVIVLSNVLEHIEKRIDFLRDLQKRYQPQKFLIRVPIFERDWRVPLKEELGINYCLDPTHYIEYRQEEFAEEIARAGLRISHSQVNWGEIWAEVVANDF
jgi:glycosyltransferase involved in cell wall biosynthesis/2-polyprenyl-3-methyl-5-hydroxy-6-metoxy-1,4-benzoquinol methylase